MSKGSRPVTPTGTASQPRQGETAEQIIESVPILEIKPGYSPRLRGEDSAHIRRLAEIETKLPPILVERRTMQVIDGMHRLRAASLKGLHGIEVEFFDGTPEEAFLRAVQSNVTHGFPLAQADRRAAAAKIIASHPDMSDRAIAELSGLGTRAVATIRRTTETAPRTNARVGRDGKVRPLDGASGRRRAAKLIAEDPNASLREVARCAGVSPATVRDVRMRLERGEDPVPATPRRAPEADQPFTESAMAALDQRNHNGHKKTSARAAQRSPSSIIKKLIQDPSLRHNENGRRLLRFLQNGAVEEDELFKIIAAIPPHCSVLVKQLARHNSEVWLNVALELETRVRITDPWERGDQMIELGSPLSRLPPTPGA